LRSSPMSADLQAVLVLMDNSACRIKGDFEINE
jgi:hypothetical protein